MAKPEPEARVFLDIRTPPELGPEWVGDRLCVARRARDSNVKGIFELAAISGGSFARGSFARGGIVNPKGVYSGG